MSLTRRPRQTVPGTFLAPYRTQEPKGVWNHTFQDPNQTAGDQFGISVALAGRDVLLGAAGANGPGATYLYDYAAGPSAQQVNLRQTFADPNNLAGNGIGDAFGNAVAMSGSTVAVGAPNVNGYRGEACIYQQPATLNGRRHV